MSSYTRAPPPSNLTESSFSRPKLDFPRFDGGDRHGWIYKILHRFGSMEYDDPSEALTRLKQVTTVERYQSEFKRLSQQIDKLPE
ncbi:hypothetical protein FEM48_Zijuj04G0014500 [Ziziphus jujuba var. spinosa]|uniref:Retrotransposon gag domain-containing protein n=1 Tax=Ziziphus jujuba var. spinosa TaxID=714518 RepID=A0A978VH20_ZIZJJ|nr:hypothetical protein FEM48_Zijuj04G0014500 [Ziziphus jujuba var. spinosa]